MPGNDVGKILYLEPIGGIAGDMFLAAAVDLGVSAEQIASSLAGLNLDGWRFAVGKAARHEITGTRLDVQIEHRGSKQRPFAEIRTLIENASTLPPRARERALRVFELIGQAEAKIHATPMESVHFHEVGAVDSIVDICGAAVALELLGDPEVYAAPPPVGSGTARSAHGSMPIPAPATLEILRGVPIRFEGVGELTTPTGAALLKALSKVAPPPEFIVERVGYGIGTQDFADRANVLRASLGRVPPERAQSIYMIEANLDDCSPQLLGALIEDLIECGALDAFVVPAVMKKGRPGHLIGALASADRKDAVADALLSGSTTIGVRFYPVARTELERRYEEVDTPYGRVRIKVALRDGAVINAQPEFEDCRELARRHQVPVKEIQAEALARYRRGETKRA
jgi:uncharacterized protein (TIGR00299 family) protein